jgi:hypothetical protein
VKRRSLALAIAAALIAAAGALPVSAGPRGDSNDSDVGDLLAKFTVVALAPGQTAPDRCSSRIYFEEGTIGSIRWHFEPALSPSFQIQDCDGIGDDEADVWVNESLRSYVMINLRGPRTQSLDVVCVETFDVGIDDLCLSPGTITHYTTKIVENVPDGYSEDVFWVLDGDWQTFDMRIYEKL